MESFDDDIKAASEVVKRGGVIVYPTDTVWGIGCDATRSDAVKKVFEIKRRADSKALIVMLGSIDSLYRYVDNVPEIALQLIETAVKPTTIIYDRGINLAPELMASDGSVAIRVTNEALSNKLCRLCRRPLVSTSANISGAPTPRCFAEISDDVLSMADYVIKSRRHEDRLASPSTIIKISDDWSFKIIRK